MNRKWIRAIILGVNVLRLKFVMRQKLLISFLWFDSKRYLQSFSGNLQYCSCLSRLHAQFLLFLNCNWYSILIYEFTVWLRNTSVVCFARSEVLNVFQSSPLAEKQYNTHAAQRRLCCSGLNRSRCRRHKCVFESNVLDPLLGVSTLSNFPLRVQETDISAVSVR